MTLEPVPKLIHYIVNLWAPKSFIVTFKLETDPKLLMAKSKMALEIYKHQVVVANLLKDRKKEVTVVEKTGPITPISVADPETQEIEEPLVAKLVQIHAEYLQFL